MTDVSKRPGLTVEEVIELYAITRHELLALIAHGHVVPGAWVPGEGLRVARAAVRRYGDLLSNGKFDVVDCCANALVSAKEICSLTGWRLCEAVHVARHYGAIRIGEPDDTRFSVSDDAIACVDYRDIQVRTGLLLARHDQASRSSSHCLSTPCVCPERRRA